MVGNIQLSLAGQSSSETMLSMMKHTVKLFIEVMKHDVLHHFTGNTCQGYGPKIVWRFTVPAFMYWCDICKFPLFWQFTCV